MCVTWYSICTRVSDLSRITWKLLCDVEYISLSPIQSVVGGLQLVVIRKRKIHNTLQNHWNICRDSFCSENIFLFFSSKHHKAVTKVVQKLSYMSTALIMHGLSWIFVLLFFEVHKLHVLIALYGSYCLFYLSLCLWSSFVLMDSKGVLKNLKHSRHGVMCGVAVSMSAFLTSTFCQCWIVGSSLGWGLNFQALVCGIFFKLVVGGFLCVLRFTPLLH